MIRVLAISPHLDDAVFSAGTALAQLAMGGAEVTVATVFTASVPDPQGFALACQLDKGLGPEVDYMALRREEDQRACALIGAAARHLPFREAPHRGYGSASELFAGVRPDDAAAADIGPALAALMAELDPELVFAPQAVGAHVDHVVVVEALTRLAPSASVRWWVDHPYAGRPGQPKTPFASSFARLPVEAGPSTPEAWARKAEAALAYASQIGFQFGGEAAARDYFAAEGAGERFALEGRRDRDVPVAPVSHAIS